MKNSNGKIYLHVNNVIGVSIQRKEIFNILDFLHCINVRKCVKNKSTFTLT